MKLVLVNIVINLALVNFVSSQKVALCYSGVALRYATSPSQFFCVQSILDTWRIKVKQANCIACDKYFHCKGFKEVVQQCKGSDVKNIATALGNCRASDERDPEDKIANADGLNGINCEKKYLHICNDSNTCKHNPGNNSCSKANTNNPANPICR